MRKLSIILLLPLLFVLSACCDLKMTPETLPNGAVGTEYSAPLTVECFNVVNWFVEGELPPGLAFTSEGPNALIAGTPTQAGSFTFTVAVEDVKKEGTEFIGRDYTIVIQ